MKKPNKSNNPLDWLQATQDWFTKTEKSSGFRPFLIFILILVGLFVVTGLFFSGIPLFMETTAFILKVSVFGFILIFGVKAFQDPDFARSEKHVQNMKKITVEQLGSEQTLHEAIEVEEALYLNSVPDQSNSLLKDAAKQTDEKS